MASKKRFFYSTRYISALQWPTTRPLPVDKHYAGSTKGQLLLEASSYSCILHSLVDLGILLVDNMPNDEQQIIELAVNQQLSPTSTPVKNRFTLKLRRTTHSRTMAARCGSDRKIATTRCRRSIHSRQCRRICFYWRERNEASHAWSSKFIQHITRRWQTHQQHLHAAANSINETNNAANNIEKQWQPSLDAIEILERMGINRILLMTQSLNLCSIGKRKRRPKHLEFKICESRQTAMGPIHPHAKA